MNIEQAIEILNINYYKHTWDHNDIGQNDEEKRGYCTSGG